MPKQVRAARHYQRDDDPVLRLSRSAMRGVARELKHAFNNLSSMVPVDRVAESIRNGRDPKGLINWHHYREVLRGAFDRLGKLRASGGGLGARKINGAFAAKRRKVRFRKSGYTHFTSEGAVIGATKFAATRKASKVEAGYEDRSTHGDHCSQCWMFQAVWQCCAVEGVINPNGWCTYWETVFAKTYNPDEPRDERGRWTDGGSGGEMVFRAAEGQAAQVEALDSITTPGHFYRGMEEAEYAATVGAGKGVESAQHYSIRGEGTSFAEDARTSESYANYGRSDPRLTGRPNYLVEVKGSEGINYDRRDGYYKAPAVIPQDRVSRAWEMRGNAKGEVVARQIFPAVAKAYNPDEPRDERGRWTTGGAPEDDRLVGDRTITDGQGNRIAAPRTFYRAVNEGDSRRISTGVASWDSLLFASDKPEGARPYGKVISRIDAKPEARILYEGTKEYRSLAAGLKGSLLDVSSGVAGRAAAAGYDAVWFKRQSDVGTAIINRAAFHFRGELTFGKSVEKATGDQFNFDSFSPAVQAAARAEQDRLIQQLEADARDTIDAVISAGLADGTSADDMASEISDVIGLTETQWNAVDNYRNMLEELDPDSLVRRLRNPEYDAVVQDSIDAQTDLSEAAIENMVSDYIENYIDYRAATIAQTESTRAANLGLHDAYDQAIERGALTDGAITRFWQLGDNPCPVCESIVDNNPDGVGVDEAFDSLDGPIDDPPVHPNCECSVDYVTDLNQVPDDGEEDRFGGGPGSFGVGGVDTPYMDDGGEE